MACRLDGAEPLSKPMMEYSSLWTNFIQISAGIFKIFIQENAFENVVRKMTAILSWSQGVNTDVAK